MMKRSYPDKPFFSWMAWGMLKSCPRRWFLHNFGRSLPGDEGLNYFIERKLSYWQAFAGQLADDGVTEAIRHFKRHGVWRQDMDQWLHARGLDYRRESLAYTAAAYEGHDLPDVKHQVLDRYFFGDEPDAAEHRRVLQVAREAVRNFYGSDLPHKIESAPRSALMCDHKESDFPWAEHDGVPIYAVYDFAIKTPERVTIYDWKTGRVDPEKEDAAMEQLHWYALYAMEAWQVASEKIRLAPVFLSASTQYVEVTPDPDRLQRIRSEWQEKHREIKALMNLSKDSTGLQEHFPITESLRECSGCVFRSCPGYARIQQARAVNPVKFALPGEID